jgi:hypothetical protein
MTDEPSGDEGPGDRIKVSEKRGIIDALRALEVFKALIAHDAGRRRYADADPADKGSVFDEQRDDPKTEEGLRRVRYEDIPEDSRAVLESLTAEQLEGLSKIDTQFVADGLYVDVPSPGKLMIH